MKVTLYIHKFNNIKYPHVIYGYDLTNDKETVLKTSINFEKLNYSANLFIIEINDGFIDKILGEVNLFELINNLENKIIQGCITYGCSEEIKRLLSDKARKILEKQDIEKKEITKKIFEEAVIKLKKIRKATKPNPLLGLKAAEVLIDESEYFFSYKNKEVLGVPTGIKNLDEATDGIFGLVGLTGTPGIGKTSFALQITDNAIKKDYETVYLTLEITRELLLSKLAAFKSGTFVKKNLKRFLSYEEARDFYNAIEELLDLQNFYIIDEKNNPSLKLLEEVIESIKKEKPNKEILIVVDYLNIFHTPEIKEKDKNERIAKLIMEFIRLKNKTKANFLIILAKNKQGYKTPGLASIKGDNNLEYGLETIISLEKPEDLDLDFSESEEFNTVAVIIKNRWGEAFRKVPLNFVGRESRFYEVKIKE